MKHIQLFMEFNCLKEDRVCESVPISMSNTDELATPVTWNVGYVYIYSWKRHSIEV